ncbi:MAG: CesT family type III secretion system chaperone [Polyangiaceae bacterium]
MSNEVLEGYLNKLERGFERSEDGTYLVSAGTHRPPIALRVAQPVLVAQVDVGPAPDDDAPTEAKLFRHLLELNASDLLHSAYALENGRIVLTAALELANMDLNEFEAILADMDLALAEHVPGLKTMVEGKES